MTVLKISKIPEGEELKIRFLGEGIVGWEYLDEGQEASALPSKGSDASY